MILFYVVVLIGCIWGLTLLIRRRRENPPAPSEPEETVKCPWCGSPATVHGNTWECGWCGDSGMIETERRK